MLQCIRTNSENKDFIKLVRELDADLSIRDGDEHAFYDQFNKIDSIKYVVVAYQETFPAACGAIKAYADDTMEVKRMYVVPEQRGQGIASHILQELEHWARELKYSRCILETGLKQPEAIALYQKNGYSRIENYGQYAQAKNSICFEKILQ
jgi:GNAT superfamily N-acetyltransferase